VRTESLAIVSAAFPGYIRGSCRVDELKILDGADAIVFMLDNLEDEDG
jgi:hypothetical protein